MSSAPHGGAGAPDPDPAPRGLRAEARALSRAERWWLCCGALAGGLLLAGGIIDLSGAGSPIAWWLGLLACASYGGWTVWLTLTDVRAQRLPNAVVLWASCTVLGALAVALLLDGAAARLGAALIAAAVATGLAALAWLVRPGFMGAGDVKLVPLTVCLAAVQDPRFVLFVFLGVVVLVSAIATIVTLVRRREVFSFGPVLLLASWCSLTLGPVLITARW